MIRRCILQAVITLLFLCPSFVFAATRDSPCKIPDQFLKERPDPEGVPTRVTVGLYLVDIIEINSKKQIFTADLSLFLSWSVSLHKRKKLIIRGVVENWNGQAPE